MRKASDLSAQTQNLEPNWQLFGKMRIFDEGFGRVICGFVSLTDEVWIFFLDRKKIPLGD